MKHTTARVLQYHAYTIWLFTRSDLKTIVIPNTFFALIFTFSGFATKDGVAPSAFTALSRLCLATLWVWINLLPFAIENQRQEDSILEDAQNKPWRPLPSKRLSTSTANRLMVALYVIAILASRALGGLTQSIALIGLGYWYNDLKGADSSCITRNLINGMGYICFTSGALEVFSGHMLSECEPVVYQWLFIVGAVISTSVQAQDMPDQEGDSLRERWTVPLVIGDSAARWSIVVPVTIWSFVCPTFWQMEASGYVATVALGMLVNIRFLSKRTIEADKMTFLIYNFWIISLYLLPLIKRYTSFDGSVMLSTGDVLPWPSQFSTIGRNATLPVPTLTDYICQALHNPIGACH